MYLRIVVDIRHRIASGQLKAGDRVPSARQITREWGVAIATATKVLSTLRTDGLVRAVPGVGTVVSTPVHEPTHTIRQRDPRAPGQELAADRLVRVAIEMADADGLAALSMRRLAAHLGLATMSLYGRVHSKDELVLMMADAAIGDDPLPGSPGLGWRAELELIARHQWTNFRRHPWLAQVLSMTRPQLLPNGIAHTERILRAFDGLGLDANTMLHAAVALISHVRGSAMNFEAQAQAEQDTGLTDEQWMTAQEPTFAALFAAGEHHMLSNITAQPDVDLDLESLFEFGLQRLLDGFAALIRETHNRALSIVDDDNAPR